MYLLDTCAFLWFLDDNPSLSKRARDIIEGKPKLTEVKVEKPVSIAANEIAEDLITYSREEIQNFGIKKCMTDVRWKAAAEAAFFRGKNQIVMLETILPQIFRLM